VNETPTEKTKGEEEADRIIREHADLREENRRLRTIIRKMTERGSYAPLAIVEFNFAGTMPQIIVCTADRSEKQLGDAIANAWCEAFGWKRGGEMVLRGVGNEGED
jgi:hypothetical protein